MSRYLPTTLLRHLLGITLAAMPLASHAIEEPEYAVIRHFDGVELRQVPAEQWAVIRYSGTWSQSNYHEHLALLRAALDNAGVATQGEPMLARYNSPFTPWFLRRNEIWLALQ